MLFSSVVFEISSGGSHQLCQTSWQPSPIESPVSIYGVLALQAHSGGSNYGCEGLELNSDPHAHTAKKLSMRLLPSQ